MAQQNKLENIMGLAATRIADEISADAIISVERHNLDSGTGEENSPFFDVKVSVFKRVNKNAYSKSEYCTKIKRPEPGSITPLRELLMNAIASKYINKGERVVCIQDGTMGAGYKGMLAIFDVDKMFFDMSTNKLAEHIKPEVIEAVFEIAMDIIKEGREGKKVGTAFIIGNRDVYKYAKQLIINPFKHIDDSEKRITDPAIRETIKEFAQLDGVFFVDEEGVVISAGTYINIDSSELDFPSGMGTRHRSCAAITAKTDAIALVISESGGKVRVFKNGRVVMVA